MLIGRPSSPLHPGYSLQHNRLLQALLSYCSLHLFFKKMLVARLGGEVDWDVEEARPEICKMLI